MLTLRQKRAYELGYSNKNNKFEKAEKVIDRDEDVIVLCSMTKENVKESIKKKVHFMEDVQRPTRLV